MDKSTSKSWSRSSSLSSSDDDVLSDDGGGDDNAKTVKPRILIVDDEADILLILKRGLEQHGFEVTTFTDPRAALANYKPGLYDLLLLDIRMPGLNGFELYREIHKMDGKVKICFLTAFEIYFDEFRKMFPKVHVRCFARKPITPLQLKQIISNELEIEEQQKQLDR